MSEAEANLTKFKELTEFAYNLEKALEYAKMKREDLDDLRTKVLELDNVPKSILDHQVGCCALWFVVKFCLARDVSYYIVCSTFSCCHS